MYRVTYCAPLFALAAAACAAQPAPSAGATTSEDPAAVVEAFLAKRGGEPEVSLTPQSLDDVLEVLRRDQLDLFPLGAAYALTQSGVEAKSLHAQIELAWGEANVMLAEVLWDHADRLRPRVRRLELQGASGGLDEAETRELSELRAEVVDYGRVGDALMTLASEHVARGAEMAREVIAASPDSYLGYRVAADYYRMQQDWPKFDEMVAQIETTNPDSNGLLFLQALAAAQRDFDFAKAAELLGKTLERDPKFTRARAHLMLVQPDVSEQYTQYVALKEQNASHRIVVWAGEAMEQDYAHFRAGRAAHP